MFSRFGSSQWSLQHPFTHTAISSGACVFKIVHWNWLSHDQKLVRWLPMCSQEEHSQHLTLRAQRRICAACGCYSTIFIPKHMCYCSVKRIMEKLVQPFWKVQDQQCHLTSTFFGGFKEVYFVLLSLFLQEFDFHVRWPGVKLLTTLLKQQGPQVQQIVLVCPMGKWSIFYFIFSSCQFSRPLLKSHNFKSVCPAFCATEVVFCQASLLEICDRSSLYSGGGSFFFCCCLTSTYVLVSLKRKGVCQTMLTETANAVYRDVHMHWLQCFAIAARIKPPCCVQWGGCF